MVEMNFRYFLNGVETKKELIDWQRTDGITVQGDKAYVEYTVPEKKGLSTRHKIQEEGRYHPYAKEEKDIDSFADYMRTYAEALKEGIVPKALKQDGFQQDSAVEQPVGVKHNKSKAPLSIVLKQFPKALEAISRCSEYGHNKYKETDVDFLNFKRVPGGSTTYADAGLRHRLEIGLDSESGLPHQYHTAWNALAELQLWIEENGNI